MSTVYPSSVCQDGEGIDNRPVMPNTSWVARLLGHQISACRSNPRDEITSGEPDACESGDGVKALLADGHVVEPHCNGRICVEL